MPAITVDDVTELKRLSRVGESATIRAVRAVVTERTGRCVTGEAGTDTRSSVVTSSTVMAGM